MASRFRLCLWRLKIEGLFTGVYALQAAALTLGSQVRSHLSDWQREIRESSQSSAPCLLACIGADGRQLLLPGPRRRASEHLRFGVRGAVIQPQKLRWNPVLIDAASTAADSRQMPNSSKNVERDFWDCSHVTDSSKDSKDAPSVHKSLPAPPCSHKLS